MKIATAEILRNIDNACVSKLGIPMLVLMENAALKVLKHMEVDNYQSYAVVCGTGNNGGDGLALARHLHVSGKKVKVFLISSGTAKLSECARINYDIIKNMNISIKNIDSISDLEGLRAEIAACQVTVDALFGTGLKRKVEGIFDAVISVINEKSNRVFSIDIPSGLNSDSGIVMGNSVISDKTISFQLYKRGFLNYESMKYTGEIFVEPIGIPDDIVEKYHNREFITEMSFLKENIKKREKFFHKGDNGKAVIIAGSKGFYGAAFIAAEVAVRCGSGLVTLLSSADVIENLSKRLTEAMTASYEDKNKMVELLNKCDAVGFGPGVGNNEEAYNLLCNVIENIDVPIVIDADGINVMAGHIEKFVKWNKEIVITPHLGEMSRLTGKSIDYIKENRIDVAKEFAKEHNIVVLLKGYNTVVTDGDNTYINPTGSSAMANGGMGDCLTGIITSLIGQGLKPMEAAVCGAYIHGYTGDVLAKDMHTVNASHIIERLPFAIKDLIE